MTWLFCVLHGFGKDARLDFGFPSNFTASACNMIKFSLAALISTFLDPWQMVTGFIVLCS